MSVQIPGYQLGKEVSAGSFSSLHTAVESKTGKTVSVRIFNESLSTNEEFCQQFKNTVFPLLNQTIGVMVPVRKAVVDSKHCYLISDHFQRPKPALESALTFIPEQILQFAQQLAGTLEALHNNNLVHGGVEASNIVFTEQSQIKLDFLALHKTLPSLSHHSIPASNFEQSMYLAPEAAQGPSPATDFFSLGVLLFQLLNRQDPFDAANLQQLQQLKKDFRLRLPRKSLNRLKPLFTQLLHPEPDKRISSAQGLHKAIESSGYSVLRPVYSIHLSPSPAPGKEALDERQAGNVSSGRKFVITSMALICAVTAGVFTLYSVPQKPPAADLTAVAEPVNRAPAEAPNSVNEEQTRSTERAESLYQEALQNIKKNNYGSALINANSALRESPVHQQAQQLKRQIETELEARALILEAQQQISKRKLTKPPGDNALETFSRLARLLPQQDKRAQQGIEKIAAYYYGLAKIEFSKRNIDKALNYIDSGYSVVPDYQPLNEINQTVADYQRREAQRRQQEKIRAARARDARLLKLKREQEKAALEQLNQAESHLQEEELNEFLRLLATAGEYLQPENLTLSAITSAKSIYLQLNELAIVDSRIDKLKQDILHAYNTLAITQKNSARYYTALITVKQGLLMDSDNEDLRLVQNEIRQLMQM